MCSRDRACQEPVKRGCTWGSKADSQGLQDGALIIAVLRPGPSKTGKEPDATLQLILGPLHISIPHCNSSPASCLFRWRLLQEGQVELVELAALLHDVGDHKYSQDPEGDLQQIQACGDGRVWEEGLLLRPCWGDGQHPHLPWGRTWHPSPQINSVS
jgi:hypothetical protein